MVQRTQVRTARNAITALVDVVFVLSVVVALACGLLAILDPRANAAAAHLYARQFGLTEEVACPSAAGNGFWFSCAGEVRRIHPPAEITISERGRQSTPPVRLGASPKGNTPLP